MKKKIQSEYSNAILLFLRMSGWIVIPVIVAFVLGGYLDNKFDSSPIIFLLMLGLCFVVSMIGIVKESLKEYKRIESLSNNKKELDN
jgi:F0F1-type ATP synthase assembly protein I